MDLTTTNDTPAKYGHRRALSSAVIPWEARLAIARLLGEVSAARMATTDAARRTAIDRISAVAAEVDRAMGNAHRYGDRPDHCLDQEYLEHLYLHGQ